MFVFLIGKKVEMKTGYPTVVVTLLGGACIHSVGKSVSDRSEGQSLKSKDISYPLTFCH